MSLLWASSAGHGAFSESLEGLLGLPCGAIWGHEAGKRHSKSLNIDSCSILDVPGPEKPAFRLDESTIFAKLHFPPGLAPWEAWVSLDLLKDHQESTSVPKTPRSILF